MKKTISYTLTALFLLITGCGSEDDKPPVILKGQDPCDNCFMIINETQYAASLKLSNGDAKRFDDVGCLLSYLEQHRKEVKKCWVYNFTDAAPIYTDKAFFIRSDKIITPMGSGIISFNTKEEAAKYAEGNTGTLTFNELTINQNNMEHN